MKPNLARELIPRDDALHPIGALNVMKDETHNAAHQWELLDEDGHVPATPPYTVLLQDAADAQDLSHQVLRLTSAFARSPHHATGRAYLRRTSEALRDAAAELGTHLGSHRFLAQLTRQEAPPAPPAPRPSGRPR